MSEREGEKLKYTPLEKCAVTMYNMSRKNFSFFNSVHGQGFYKRMCFLMSCENKSKVKVAAVLAFSHNAKCWKDHVGISVCKHLSQNCRNTRMWRNLLTVYCFKDQRKALHHQSTERAQSPGYDIKSHKSARHDCV